MAVELSTTEENYLKHIFHIENDEGKMANTNALAAALGTSAASTSDMVIRLSKKGLVSHEKYKGVVLTKEGRNIAIDLIRKHRLWEVFLVEKLGFGWEQVHSVAEQLEHINSELLIKRLDQFLGYPKTDPHGDPIPTIEGELPNESQLSLLDLEERKKAFISNVKQDEEEFLRYCSHLGLVLGAKVEVTEKFPFDGSMKLLVNTISHHVPHKVCKEIYVNLSDEEL
ncbi:MAG: metal-dependent transcriptional regulator [Cytophagales bacterium]